MTLTPEQEARLKKIESEWDDISCGCYEERICHRHFLLDLVKQLQPKLGQQYTMHVVDVEGQMIPCKTDCERCNGKLIHPISDTGHTALSLSKEFSRVWDLASELQLETEQLRGERNAAMELISAKDEEITKLKAELAAMK